MAKKSKPNSNTIALNKKAKFDYFIEDRYEAGLVLLGWEVKTLREGKGNITESYIVLQNGEAWLVGAHFTPLKTASTHLVPEPMRARKLLLNRKELEKLIGAKEKKGFTIVPLALYWKNNLVKVEIGTGKGKKQHDKRATIKDRESKRDLSRVVKHNQR